jgi:hypothetical protein
MISKSKVKINIHQHKSRESTSVKIDSLAFRATSADKSKLRIEYISTWNVKRGIHRRQAHLQALESLQSIGNDLKHDVMHSPRKSFIFVL